MSKNTILEGKPCIYIVYSWVLLPHPSQLDFITKYDFHIYKGVYKFVCKCMLSFHYLPICLSYFFLSPSIYLSVLLFSFFLFSQKTPHPLNPNPFQCKCCKWESNGKKCKYNDPMVFFIKKSCKDVGLKYSIVWCVCLLLHIH